MLTGNTLHVPIDMAGVGELQFKPGPDRRLRSVASINELSQSASAIGVKADSLAGLSERLLLAKRRLSRFLQTNFALAAIDAVGWEPSTASEEDNLALELRLLAKKRP